MRRLNLLWLAMLMVLGIPISSGADSCATPGQRPFNTVMLTLPQLVCNKTFDNTQIYQGGALSGTFTGSPTFSGNPVFSGFPVFQNGLGFDLTSMTLTTPTLLSPTMPNGAVINGAVTGNYSLNGLVTATGTTTAATQGDRFARAVHVRDEGAVGDGTTNDRQAFLDTDADTSGPIFCSAGTYFISSNMTLTSPLAFLDGCVLKPNAGVTITLSGGVVAADTGQIFDVSAAGSLINVGGRIRPEWYGDVTGDATAEMQAAINSGALSGGCISPLARSYFLSATLTVSTNNVCIVGEGVWNTIFTRSGDYGDTLFATGNNTTGTQITDFAIQKVTFLSTGLTTSGAHINMEGVTRGRLKDIRMQSGFVGIRMAASSQTYLDSIHIIFSNLFGGTVTGRKYIFFAVSTGAYAAPGNGGIFVENFNVRANSPFTFCEYGIEFNASDGIWFSNGHVGGTTGANIHFNANNVETIGLVEFSNVFSDASSGPGLVFEGNTSNAKGIQFTNLYGKGGSGGTIGLSVLAGAKFYNVQFDNCVMSEYAQHGVLMASAEAKNWSFNGCDMRGNSDSASNTYDGYHLTAGDEIHITGGVSGGSNVSPTGTATQRYGIFADASVLNLLVDGVTLLHNVTGPLSIDPAARTTALLKANITGESRFVASATTIEIPFGFDTFHLTGTTTVDTIAAPTMDRVITLIANGSVTVSVAGNIKLAGSVDFVMTADDTLTLRWDTVNWVEVGRAVI